MTKKYLNTLNEAIKCFGVDMQLIDYKVSRLKYRLEQMSKGE